MYFTALCSLVSLHFAVLVSLHFVTFYITCYHRVGVDSIRGDTTDTQSETVHIASYKPLLPLSYRSSSINLHTTIYSTKVLCCVSEI